MLRLSAFLSGMGTGRTGRRGWGRGKYDWRKDILEGSLSGLPELEIPRYEKDRSGQFMGNGIWKTYDETATLSDG